MKNNKFRFVLYFIIIAIHFLSLQLIAEPVNKAKSQVSELVIRGNLPNFFAKAKAKDSINVAYLGGSISAQDGWRVFSMEWFKHQFPSSKFSEINATIGGTGSKFGVYRLYEQVLRFNPDLIFIEFAVNDDGLAEQDVIRSMEGIVRQVWQYNLKTDICFVYTTQKKYISNQLLGQLPKSVVFMEKVADAYKIPSINFGIKICKQVKENKLIIEGKPHEINEVKVFSSDGVHPYVETGHMFYQEVLKRSFEKMETKVKALHESHILPEPISPDFIKNPKLIDCSKVELSKNWTFINGKELNVQLGPYFPSLATASQTGETLNIRFKGTAIGAYDIMGKGTGKVIVEIDGNVKDTISRFDSYCIYNRESYFIIEHLKDTTHNVTFRVLSEPFDKEAILKQRGETMKNPEDYKYYNWYVEKIMIDGEFLP